MPSFDIVSEINLQEADNAINQARKEIEGRFDFKGSQSEIQWDKKEVTLVGDDEYKMEAMKSILQTKLHRRGIDIKVLDYGKIEPAGGKMLRQKISMKQGIDRDVSKDILKTIKDSKLKVQGQIVDEKVRVTGKSLDDLQATMQLIRQGNFSIPLQFNNMRS
ncbi:MAG TPA: YajQ family cyclic di-GMP-binding protein [Pseudobdellovibrionaceae bacterium]|nr:YajQ family cyclic di-GMP-binding protein [Pseudobdellovibrionaceae bacterium]